MIYIFYKIPIRADMKAIVLKNRQFFYKIICLLETTSREKRIIKLFYSTFI